MKEKPSKEKPVKEKPEKVDKGTKTRASKAKAKLDPDIIEVPTNGKTKESPKSKANDNSNEEKVKAKPDKRPADGGIARFFIAKKQKSS